MTDLPAHRRLPPLTALRTLEALHLTGSVTAAAQRLRVSHSAVSHQVRLLEEWSDTPLFLREGRVTRLTDAGQSLAAIAHGAFDAIRHEIDRLPLRRVTPVTVAALPVVATGLILPNLPALLRNRPDTRVHVTLALPDRPTTPPPDIEVLFLRRAALTEGDIVLLPGDALAACAPALLARHGGDRDRLLREGPLIHDEDLRMWPTWRDVAGHPRDGVPEDTHVILEGSGLIHAAIVSGLGAGFVRRALAAEDIAAGRLAVLSDVPIDLDWAYVLRADHRRADHPDVRAFTLWLRELCRGRD